MANAAVVPRLHQDIARLVHRGLPVAEFSRAVGDALSRAVPAEGSCLMTTDPATLLPTAEYVENGMPADDLLRMVDLEVREPDFNKWVRLAAAELPAASLSGVTEGRLDRSLRQREIRRPGGFADELRVVLRGSTGTWGQLTVFREANRRYFSADEVQLVASVAGSITDGLRRGMLSGEARRGGGDVGVLLLDAEDGVQLSNPAAQRWLDELGAGARPGARLPLVVTAIARRTRAFGRAELPGRDLRPATARVRTRTGQWLIVRGSLMNAEDSLVTVLIEAARPAEMAPVMAEAYGFTARERRVTELVAKGLSTRQIAAQLHLSAYTVQDHLKSIFAKSGTGSRGDLVARLFFDHYAGGLAPTAAVSP